MSVALRRVLFHFKKVIASNACWRTKPWRWRKITRGGWLGERTLVRDEAALHFLTLLPFERPEEALQFDSIPVGDQPWTNFRSKERAKSFGGVDSSRATSDCSNMQLSVCSTSLPNIFGR